MKKSDLNVKDMIKNNLVDKIYTVSCENNVKVQLRIMKYTIYDEKTKVNKPYYLGTTLLNDNIWPITKLKELYHDRWLGSESQTWVDLSTRGSRIIF